MSFVTGRKIIEMNQNGKKATTRKKLKKESQ